MDPTNDKWCVYMHTNLSNGKKYIGITSKEPNARWKDGRGYRGSVFGDAIAKYGWDGFRHEVVMSGLTAEVAKAKEVELIRAFNTMDRDCGYNRTAGGDGTVGIVMSEETRDRMRLSRIGKHHSAATKEKMSNAAKGNTKWLGKHHTEETKKKMSVVQREYHKIHPVTDEERKAMSERAKKAYNDDPTLSDRISASKKRLFAERPEIAERMSVSRTEYYKNHPEAREKLSEEHKKSVDMLSVDGKWLRTFDSLSTAQNELHIDHSSIARVCKGKQITAGGYKWRYHNNNVE